MPPYICDGLALVNCRIGSLEIMKSALSSRWLVNCRIGSLEIDKEEEYNIETS